MEPWLGGWREAAGEVHECALASLAFTADDSVAGNHGVQYGRWSFLFTMASMVIMVNSVLGGATAGLLFALALKTGLLIATVIGVVVGQGPPLVPSHSAEQRAC